MVTSFMFVGCNDPEPEPTPPAVNTPNNGDTNTDEGTTGGNESEATYTVKFYYSDESSAGEDVTGKKAGEEVTLPTLTAKEGKTFSGWYLTKTAEGTAISSSLSGGKYTVKAEDAKEGIIKLYAVYIENSSAIEVESISVSPVTVSNLQVGNTQQLTVSYNPVDANVGNSVTYVSDATNVATVDANGLVKAITAGNAVITVTSGNGKTATVNVTVVPKPKVLVDVILGKTDDTTFTATAKFDDSTTLDVTDEANWISTDTSVATVSLGNVEILEAGTTKISASYTYEGAEQTSAEATIVVEEIPTSSGEIDKLYFITTSQWSDASPRYAAYFFGNGEKWVDMTEYSSGVYVCDKQEGFPSVIFCRMSPSVLDNNWNNKWNQTSDLTIPSDKDTYKYDDGQWDNGTGEWLSTLTGNYGSSEGGFNVTVTMPEVSDDNNGNNNDNPVIPDDPVIPSGTYRVHLYNCSWANANIYYYGSGKTNAAWPGVSMISENNGWYYDMTETWVSAGSTSYVFNNGSDQYPANGNDDEIPSGTNEAWFDFSSKTWHTTNPHKPTAPSILISPDDGYISTSGSIRVTINTGNSAITDASVEVSGVSSAIYDYDDFTNNSLTISVKNLTSEADKSIYVSASVTNAIGSDTDSVTYTTKGSVNVELSGNWNELTIYQVMVSSFQDGDPSRGYQYAYGPSSAIKGGDLQGIINAADYIKELGCNAIWMTPIFNSNGEGHLDSTGYFTYDYFNVDPKFGTNEKFRELVETYHEKGMYVILDGVFGHWGANVAPSPTGKTPTRSNGQYKACDYPASLEFFKEVATYWIKEYKIDGWRLDQCYQVGLGENALGTMADNSGTNGHNYWYEIRTAVEQAAQENANNGEEWGTLGYMVGEHWRGDAATIQNGSVIPGPNGIGYGLKSCFDFPSRYKLVQNIAREEGNNTGNDFGGALSYTYGTSTDKGYYHPDGYWPNLFFTNHDLVRLGNLINWRFSETPSSANYFKRHKVAMAVLAAYSGPITIYYGDEWGAYVDGYTKDGALGANNDNCARSTGKISGFTSAEQDCLNYAKSLMNMRSENEVLWNGDSSTLVSQTSYYVGKKTLGSEEVIFIINNGTNSVSYNCSGTDMLTGQTVSGSVTCDGLSARFIRVK